MQRTSSLSSRRCEPLGSLVDGCELQEACREFHVLCLRLTEMHPALGLARIHTECKNDPLWDVLRQGAHAQQAERHERRAKKGARGCEPGTNVDDRDSMGSARPSAVFRVPELKHLRPGNGARRIIPVVAGHPREEACLHLGGSWRGLRLARLSPDRG